MNEFIVGGMTETFRNQITFAGLQEGTLYSPALATLQGGMCTFDLPALILPGGLIYSSIILSAEAISLITQIFIQVMLLHSLIISH